VVWVLPAHDMSEYGKEPSRSIKCGSFNECLRNSDSREETWSAGLTVYLVIWLPAARNIQRAMPENTKQRSSP